MRVEIITPECEVYKGEAEALLLPGIDGYFGVLNNHAPLIAALKKGSMKMDLAPNAAAINDGGGKIKYAYSPDKKSVHIDIKGGTIEVLSNKVIILAE
jgi:F-type H+-transporting ATPase subunit epsilon